MRFLILLIVYSVSLEGFTQTQNRKYLYAMDSVAQEIVLHVDSMGVDTILSAFYHLDNGRGSNATKIIIWKTSGKTFVNAVKLDEVNSYVEFGEKELQSNSIFDFFFENQLDTVANIPQSGLRASHGFGYSVDLRYGSIIYSMYLRNDKRNANPLHLKSQWIKMIDNVGKQYYQ